MFTWVYYAVRAVVEFFTPLPDRVSDRWIKENSYEHGKR